MSPGAVQHTGLRLDTVGFQQFLHRHEAVAFPLKRIYNLQCRVHRGIVDIMEQDDLIGGRIFQDRRLHLGCIELFPVPGIDGPLYHGHLQQLPVRRIHGPVWRRSQYGPPPSNASSVSSVRPTSRCSVSREIP